MKSRTAIIALSVFFISAIVLFVLWEVENHKVPFQVQFLNKILNSEMKTSDNANWEVEGGGINYQLFNAKGKGTGYSRLVVTVDVNKADDLSNIRKIASQYFPDKAGEIYSAVSSKYDKFKNKKIDMVDYRYTEQGKKVTVRAFNVSADQYVGMEILLPS